MRQQSPAGPGWAPLAIRAAARRISWGLADQAVSSLTNFAVGIFVARSLGATEFGIFSLAWITYGVLLNVSRGLASDPLVVRFSGVPETSWRAATARATGTALAVGILSGMLSLLVGTVLGGPLGSAFVALGLILPGLLLQDCWRYAFFACGQGRKAFLNDAVWGLLLIPSLMVAALDPSVFGFSLAWGASGTAAALFGYAQTRILPRLGEVAVWMRQQRDLGARYLAENIANSGGSQIRMYGLGAIAGLADVGAIRGAELLSGPFLAILMGLSLVAVPEAARVLRRSPRRLPLFCLALGGSQAAAALAWGLGLMLLLPDHVGRMILGSVWESSSVLILPVTLSIACASFSTGAAAGLRALGAARRSLRSQLVVSVFYVGGGLIGAVIDGAEGSSWGVACGMLISAVIWWAQLRAGLRDHTVQSRSDSPQQTREK